MDRGEGREMLILATNLPTKTVFWPKLKMRQFWQSYKQLQKYEPSNYNHLRSVFCSFVGFCNCFPTWNTYLQKLQIP